MLKWVYKNREVGQVPPDNLDKESEYEKRLYARIVKKEKPPNWRVERHGPRGGAIAKVLRT